MHDEGDPAVCLLEGRKCRKNLFLSNFAASFYCTRTFHRTNAQAVGVHVRRNTYSIERSLFFQPFERNRIMPTVILKIGRNRESNVSVSVQTLARAKIRTKSMIQRETGNDPLCLLKVISPLFI